MDARVNESFVNAANALTELLKESQHTIAEAYERGRTEAYTDVVNWLLQAEQGDLRHVTVSSLLQHLQKHLPDIKISCFPDSRKRMRELRTPD
mmetsp:Transcript_116/g.142  ORF Transcript_116/g.142 Transcript_116/m.142 type:complete len:93 (+) Transcript_116:844-1122(+)